MKLGPCSPVSWHDSRCVVQSDVVRINLNHGTTEMRLPSVGVHAHGLVLWHDELILLDSEGSALVAIHPPSSTPDIIWRVSPAEAQRARSEASGGKQCGATQYWPDNACEYCIVLWITEPEAACICHSCPL
jgi:hypothetical protein